MHKGIWYAIGAYVSWGLFPVYWKWLGGVPVLQLISHRIVWSAALLICAILLLRRGRVFYAAARAPGALPVYLAAALLVGINWLVYIWAVNAGYIIETSLGYFINPLLSVLFGVLFLRERLRRWQWLPLAIAAAGVLYLAYAQGRPPWIALALAFSFALYGLVKKTAPLGAFYGLTLETGILLTPALLYLLYCAGSGSGAFLHSGTLTDVLLVGAGAVTTLPLLLFAAAAQSIPLTQMGVLQYINPTLQLLLGTLFYGEPFGSAQMVGFGLVWIALIVFGIEGFCARRARAGAASVAAAP